MSEELEPCFCEDCTGPYTPTCQCDGWCEACHCCNEHCQKEELCSAYAEMDRLEAKIHTLLDVIRKVRNSGIVNEEYYLKLMNDALA